MPGWDDILKQIQTTKNECDYVRMKCLEELHKITGRNVIAYYSSFLTKQGVMQLDVNDLDMNGFMNSLKGMDCSLGLDLILHTPGGSPVAAEAIVKYLRSKFSNNIRVIVPQLAMSAGTMMACAAKEIIMGKSSSLGPIDPQVRGIPAYDVVNEFMEAKVDMAKNPHNAEYWRIQLNKYPAAFVKKANDAIQLSGILTREWLGTAMYDAVADKDKIDVIIDALNEHDNSKEHGRHFGTDFCKAIGLKIIDMEENQKLQDAILAIHHAFMITLDSTATVKIIESQNNKTWIKNVTN